MASIKLWQQVGQRDPFPADPPRAVPGCPACLSLAVQRENAGSALDYSGVTDANIRLRAHQAEDH
ncbi:hypothetical protein ACIQV3_38955 [Streptomyces sp. NPDC099050]|uniref:hypothetical protein n=1 Tax=Streptomyces sp. NPDC099050 TaxID=3366100 RepID=UPI0037F127FC